jgi:UDP-glucose 4-epimerase
MRVPRHQDVYACRGWSMFPDIDRVYVNERARRDLGWKPRNDFAHIIDLVHAGEDPRSPLARVVGSKGYHADAFAEGPYPVPVAVSGTLTVASVRESTSAPSALPESL